MRNLESPGLWLFLGGLEILILVHLAEFLYPGYSVSENYISDLAVGPGTPAAVFTAGIIIFGLMVLVATYFVRMQYRHSKIWILLGLSGTGALGVGFVNEDLIPVIHGIFAVLAFLFGNLAAVWSYKLVRAPFSYVCAGLGVIGIAALGLTAANVNLGLGAGGMERMIFYPAMFWVLGFGAWLMASEGRTDREQLQKSVG